MTSPQVRTVLAEAERALTARGDKAEARLEAELLLAQQLDKQRAWLYAHPDDVVDADMAQRFEALVSRRVAGEPIAYVTGHREFWSLDLAVTPHVLIPRPETELLVELALQRISPERDADVADLGTGSGAIALAIATSRPRAKILATDANGDALAVARGNATRVGAQNVSFAQGDWCAALGDRTFDVIVSNPPYIADRDPHLDEGDLRFEPRAALASGTDGLDAIRAIVHDAPSHIKQGGWLMLEHGYAQGDAVRSLLKQSGFVEVFTAVDLEGRERVSGGARPA